MTDSTGATPPFPGFPGFPPAEMLDSMWDMMRLTPFGSAFPPGSAQGLAPSLSAMSGMMAPLTNVEELDKRITDMRAVEQWLKLNLNMLQSAIQALEVQRATLATLHAFGAFAQASMTQPAHQAAPSAEPSWAQAFRPASNANAKADAPVPEAAQASDESAAGVAPGAAPFDPAGWWNLLQSQFNQLAAFAVAQPGAADAAPQGTTGEASAAESAGRTEPAGSKPAARRPAARRAAPPKSGSKAGGAAGGEKKAPARSQ
jgi:hypothetical protein